MLFGSTLLNVLVIDNLEIAILVIFNKYYHFYDRRIDDSLSEESQVVVINSMVFGMWCCVHKTKVLPKR